MEATSTEGGGGRNEALCDAVLLREAAAPSDAARACSDPDPVDDRVAVLLADAVFVAVKDEDGDAPTDLVDETDGFATLLNGVDEAVEAAGVPPALVDWLAGKMVVVSLGLPA